MISRYARILLHILFWILSLFAIGTYFSISNTLSIIDYVYSAFFNLCLVFLVYANLNFLVPKFLERGAYHWYVIGILLAIGVSLILHDIIFDILLPLLPIEFYLVSFTDRLILIQVFAIYIVVSTLLHLSESWFKLHKLQHEKLHIELNALRAQLNPHFLFNGLNSIYSLSLKNHVETPSAILKLSNLLRYSLYEVGDDLVPVEREIEEIGNYIDIQKLRLEQGVGITYNVDGEFEGEMLAPMLFLPILENAFKHGPKGKEKGFIKVTISRNGLEIIFTCSNSVTGTDDPTISAGGIGLENLSKRLELLYPGKHTLSIQSNEDKFTVELKLIPSD